MYGKSWTPGWSDSRPVLLLNQTTDYKSGRSCVVWLGRSFWNRAVFLLQKALVCKGTVCMAGRHSLSCSWDHSLYKPCSPIFHTGALLRSVTVKSVISKTETPNHMGPQITLSEIKHRNMLTLSPCCFLITKGCLVCVDKQSESLFLPLFSLHLPCNRCTVIGRKPRALHTLGVPFYWVIPSTILLGDGVLLYGPCSPQTQGSAFTLSAGMRGATHPVWS